MSPPLCHIHTPNPSATSSHATPKFQTGVADPQARPQGPFSHPRSPGLQRFSFSNVRLLLHLSFSSSTRSLSGHLHRQYLQHSAKYTRSTFPQPAYRPPSDPDPKLPVPRPGHKPLLSSLTQYCRYPGQVSSCDQDLIRGLAVPTSGWSKLQDQHH